jgi:hypothetical protein
MSVCKTMGVHRLPAGEDSWQDPMTDLLIAAGLDGCAACDNRLVGVFSRDPDNEAFGKLFSWFVLVSLHNLVEAGYYVEGRALPATGLDLFPGLSLQNLDPQTRRVLGRVRFQNLGTMKVPGHVTIGIPDQGGAVKVLRMMTRQDREAVLHDVMDSIVGGIVATQLFDARPGT